MLTSKDRPFVLSVCDLTVGGLEEFDAGKLINFVVVENDVAGDLLGFDDDGVVEA